VATEAVGIILGVVGYTLGARRLGVLAVVLCTAAMFLVLLAGQGAMPGSYDAALDGVKTGVTHRTGSIERRVGSSTSVNFEP
jgi:hypothetical protein